MIGSDSITEVNLFRKSKEESNQTTNTRYIPNSIEIIGIGVDQVLDSLLDKIKFSVVLRFHMLYRFSCRIMYIRLYRETKMLL